MFAFTYRPISPHDVVALEWNLGISLLQLGVRISNDLPDVTNEL